jgi:Flp pilus assembly protein TadG
MKPRNHKRPRGMVLIYVMVAMVATTALVSLAVDVSHVRLVKIQLQGAADAASRTGARSLGGV